MLHGQQNIKYTIMTLLCVTEIFNLFSGKFLVSREGIFFSLAHTV